MLHQLGVVRCRHALYINAFHHALHCVFIAQSVTDAERLDMVVVKQPMMMAVTVSRRGHTVLG